MTCDEILRAEHLEAYAMGRLNAEELVSLLLAELEETSPHHRRMIRRWRKRHPDGESPASRLVRRLDVLREVHPGTMRDARDLLGELWRLPPERRIDATLALARTGNRRLLVLAALDRVRSCFPSELQRVEEEIEVAHALVMSLDASTPQGPSWRASAHVRLLIYRTLHLAVTGRVLEAGRVLERALALAGKVDDRRTLALLKEAEGLVLHYRGELSRAANRLAQASEAYVAVGDEPGRCRVLQQLAEVLRTAQRPEEGLVALQQALVLLDPDAEPYLYLCCEMTHCLLLCDLDEPDSAEALLDQHRDLLERFREAPLVPYRVAVLEGRVAMARRDFHAARARFQEARLLALDGGFLLHAAHVSLDVALALLHLGDTEALRDEVAAITPILAAEGLQHEPAAALSLYRDALLSERLTRDLARRFQSYFHLATRNPHLPFRRGERGRGG